MARDLTGRLARLERYKAPELPWHLPVEQWTDVQLLAVVSPERQTITDEELRAIAEGKQ
jgi:hypothetical protein